MKFISNNVSSVTIFVIIFSLVFITYFVQFWLLSDIFSPFAKRNPHLPLFLHVGAIFLIPGGIAFFLSKSNVLKRQVLRYLVATAGIEIIVVIGIVIIFLGGS